MILSHCEADKKAVGAALGSAFDALYRCISTPFNRVHEIWEDGSALRKVLYDTRAS
jgi:hypothetical protein